MRYVFVFLATLILPAALSAQLHVGIGFNLDIQPAWGPVGYDYAEYYYLPDVEVYYNVPRHRFYYFDGGSWIFRSSLPSRYAHYDLYNSYKIVVNERNPWRNHNSYRNKYASYKGRHGQPFIRDSKDSKYFVNKNHPQHSKWAGEKKQRGGNDGNRKDYGGGRNDGKRGGSQMQGGRQGGGKQGVGRQGGGRQGGDRQGGGKQGGGKQGGGKQGGGRQGGGKNK
ncbi:MAG: hypothetical protein WC824_04275 [Bacteroidota bacterium]|jgi:hypothetical protein